MVRQLLRVFKRRLFPDWNGSERARTAEIERLRRRIVDLEAEIGRQLALADAAAVNAILHSTPESYFECDFNGVRLLLPRDTLRTMTHCLQSRSETPLRIEVEAAHSDWLRDKLRPGDTFLDVGAATGAMSLPFALSIPGIRAIAFEPSRTVNRRLRETLLRNGVDSVEVRDEAVSDHCGTTSFAEVGFDTTGKTPFYPETSAIANRLIDPVHLAATYDVPVTTLDHFFAGRTDEAAVRSVKIDVEGFEIHVLQGGAGFLGRVQPHLAIDIHRNPFAEGTTEKGVRACLEPIGYRFENIDHVLLCYPAGKR